MSYANPFKGIRAYEMFCKAIVIIVRLMQATVSNLKDPGVLNIIIITIRASQKISLLVLCYVLFFVGRLG
jgi:hypothetical protein